jgi:hypothetical protein
MDRKLRDLLNDLDGLHSEMRDFGIEVLAMIERADRYEPTGEGSDGEMNVASNGEWIHRGDLLDEMRWLVG